MIAFSGGRDSALLLAAAVGVARSRELEPPLALTLCYPRAPESEESAWQAKVLGHLAAQAAWQRIELSNELDLIGPVATPYLLDARAPLFPPNAHSVAPLAERARGGTLVMGIGGDELLLPQRWQSLNDLLAGERPPELRDVRRLAAALLPARVRGWLDAARFDAGSELPWLRPEGRRRLRRLLAETPDMPVRFDRALVQVARARYLALGLATIARIARAHGARLSAPLLDQRFVTALARSRGRRGWPSRTAAMRALASDLLPDEVLARRSKASFGGAFFTDTTRAFAARWSGRGLDDSIVDPEVLRTIWLGPSPDYRTGMLLQAAWLHDSLARDAEPRPRSALAA